jgi:hypothetical protein
MFRSRAGGPGRAQLKVTPSPSQPDSEDGGPGRQRPPRSDGHGRSVILYGRRQRPEHFLRFTPATVTVTVPGPFRVHRQVSKPPPGLRRVSGCPASERFLVAGSAAAPARGRPVKLTRAKPHCAMICGRQYGGPGPTQRRRRVRVRHGPTWTLPGVAPPTRSSGLLATGRRRLRRRLTLSDCPGQGT